MYWLLNLLPCYRQFLTAANCSAANFTIKFTVVTPCPFLNVLRVATLYCAANILWGSLALCPLPKALWKAWPPRCFKAAVSGKAHFWCPLPFQEQFLQIPYELSFLANRKRSSDYFLSVITHLLGSPGTSCLEFCTVEKKETKSVYLGCISAIHW